MLHSLTVSVLDFHAEGPGSNTPRPPTLTPAACECSHRRHVVPVKAKGNKEILGLGQILEKNMYVPLYNKYALDRELIGIEGKENRYMCQYRQETRCIKWKKLDVTDNSLKWK